MTARISFSRPGAAMIAAGVVAAVALVLGPYFMSQSDTSPETLGVVQVLVMSAFFCFFTLPVAAMFALPVGWLGQRFGPIRPLFCTMLGALCGLIGVYGTLLLTFMPTLNASSALWFGVGGAAAGLAFGWIMSSERVPLAATSDAAA